MTLVTGGAGFVGSTVVDRLVARGTPTRVLDVLHPGAHDGRPAYLHPDVEYQWADLRDPDAVDEALCGVDAVSHQASMVGLGVDFADVVDYVSHNDFGTAVLLGALRRSEFRGPLVLASSMVVYGEGRYRCATHGVVRPGPRRTEDLDAGRYEGLCPVCGSEVVPEEVTEDASVDPRNVYAATKVHQEHLCAAFAREHPEVTVTSLRYHNVYGPRMPRNTPYAGVASIVRSALERGETPQVFEDGRQRRNFVHVDDVARANVVALLAGVPGVFNVASAESHTVGEMAEALSDGFGPDAPLPRIVGGYRLGDVRHVFASPALAERELGFHADVGFAEGMKSFASAPLRSSEKG